MYEVDSGDTRDIFDQAPRFDIPLDAEAVQQIASITLDAALERLRGSMSIDGTRCDQSPARRRRQ